MMPTVRIARRFAAVSVLLGLLLCPAIVVAQEQPTAEPAQETPQPISGAEVPSRIEQAGNLIRRSDAAAAPTDAIDAIARLLPAAAEEIDRQASALAERLESGPTTRTISDMYSDWLRQRGRLAGWQSTIDNRWRGLQAIQRQLSSEISLWQLTLDALRSDDADSPVLPQIRQVLANLQAARNRLDQRLAAVLALQVTVSGAQDVITGALDRIQQQGNSARLQLFQRDGVALWSAVMAGEPLLTSLGESYREAGWAAAEFILGEAHLLLRHLLFIALVAAVLRRAARCRNQLEPAQRPRGTEALDLPYATAFLLSMPLVDLIYQRAPSILNELLLLVAIFPLLRIAPRVLPATVIRPIRWVSVLFVVYLALTPSNDQALLTRLVLAGFNPLAIAICVSTALRLRNSPAGTWRRVVSIGMRIGAVLLGISWLGTILGWSRLSWLLADGTVRSAYLAILLVAVGRVLVGLIDLWPDTPVGQPLRHLRTHRNTITRRAARIAIWVLWLAWTYMVLSLFGLIAPVTEWLIGLLAFSITVGSITISLGNVVGVLTILGATVLFSRYARFLLREEVLSRTDSGDGESNAVLTVVHYVIVAFGALMAGSAAGLSGTQLTLGAGALSVGIGFGLQAIVNNFVSGLILIFERPVSVGDRVEVGTNTGTIERIGIRASVLRTYAGSEVVIPNADLITKEVTNWTLTDRRRRVNVPVGVAYGSDTTRVLEILDRAAREEPLIIEEPEPIVYFRGFGDSSLNFELMCWSTAGEAFVAASNVALAINRGLAEAGVQIPFPQRDLHLVSVAPGIGAKAGLSAAETGGDGTPDPNPQDQPS